MAVSHVCLGHFSHYSSRQDVSDKKRVSKRVHEATRILAGCMSTWHAQEVSLLWITSCSETFSESRRILRGGNQHVCVEGPGSLTRFRPGYVQVLVDKKTSCLPVANSYQQSTHLGTRVVTKVMSPQDDCSRKSLFIDCAGEAELHRQILESVWQLSTLVKYLEKTRARGSLPVFCL